MLSPQIKSLIKTLWDQFWSGGIANPITAIEQITYLLFMRRLDELDQKRQREAESMGKSYKSKFSGEWEYEDPSTQKKKNIPKEKLRWSYLRQIPENELLLHVQTTVFPFLKELNGELSPFTRHMANAVFQIPKSSLLVEAIETIEKIFAEIQKDIEKNGQTFQDIQGEVYEMLLNEIARAGKNGQFRTPRHIIKLICELVAPQLKHHIGDPACGTAGFLLGAYQYIITQLDKNSDKRKPDEDGFIRSNFNGFLTKKQHDVLEQNLSGSDFDTTMVRLGLMNLMMHGIDNPNIDYKDTLSKSYNEEGIYDIVLANPPFTGNIDKSDINENLKLPTTKTELLFVERIYNMLKKNGGTASIIVPQGVLFGLGKAFVQARKKLVEEAELKAVISMPGGVFKPYAGVSTAILIFTKGNKTQHVWFYNMESDGRSLDDKRTKLAGFGDLQDIVTRYQQRDPVKDTDRTKKYFFIPKDEIVENEYNLSMGEYREEVYDEIQYENPESIIKKLHNLENSITTDLKELAKMYERI